MEIENSEVETVNRRRDLLPWWIKLFSWLFMIFGGLTIISFFLGFTNIKPALAFYGFETNEPFSLIGILIISIGVLKGITAFSLWFEKDYAMKLGKIDSYIGIGITMFAMIGLPFILKNGEFTIRLELIFIVLFLLKLMKIEQKWKKFNY